MFRAEDTTGLSKTELMSRIKGARNLIIGLWFIGVVNLAIVVGLFIRGTSGTNRIMGLVAGVAAVAAAVRLTDQRKEYVAALAAGGGQKVADIVVVDEGEWRGRLKVVAAVWCCVLGVNLGPAPGASYW